MFNPLEVLKKKNVVNAQEGFRIKVKREEPIKEPVQEMENPEEMNVQEEKKEDIIEEQPKIKDKRKLVNVDRNMILAKINEYKNVRVVENKKNKYNPEYKNPVIQPNIEKRIQELKEPEEEKVEEPAKEVEQEPAEEPEEEELEDIVENEPKVKKNAKTKKNAKEVKAKEVKNPRKTKKKQIFVPEGITAETKIGKKFVLNRLPQPKLLKIKPMNYYFNNRKLYVQKISKLFHPYSKELEETKDVSCDSPSRTDMSELFTHQKVIRDYLNSYTPYRGLLLYHGLGSGKTCSSIAVAEGMKTERPIVLMTPASLKMNFFTELKKCGDPLFKKQQFWEFISISRHPEYVPILASALHLHPDIIVEKGGAWMLDVSKKEPNFNELSSDQQKEIDIQLDHMIRFRYMDINYNGINRAILKRLTNDFTLNIFDNKTVIIDEAHNFVSRIVNKLGKKLLNTNSLILYKMLLDAENCKIVLLTGTPIINYPNEIGVLFNILKGYIKTWNFQIRFPDSIPKEKQTTEHIMTLFDTENLNTYDYVSYSKNKLVVTRNPFGFINQISTPPVAKGGNKNENEITVVKQKTQKIEEEIYDKEETAEYNDRINHDYYKNGGSMKTYNGIVKTDNTEQFNDEYFLNEIIRILQKNNIEITNKKGTMYVEHKALPDDSDTFKHMFVDLTENKLKNENVFKKRILGFTSYFRSADEQLLPQFEKTETGENYHIVKINMSDEQFDNYAKIRMNEYEKEKKNRGKKKAAEDDPFKSTYRIFSRVCCNFSFPNGINRPKPPTKINEKGEEKKEENEEDEYFGEEQDKEENELIENVIVPEQIENNDENAIAPEQTENNEKDRPTSKMIIETEEEQLRSYQADLKRVIEKLKNPASNGESYLINDNLQSHSPKIYKILENIRDENHRGLHLLYSQFRTLEGIGLMKAVLEMNGFAEFRIKKNPINNEWEIIENEEDAGKPRFALYTGTESIEEKEIIRNIYNGDWGVVPDTIVSRLKQMNPNNLYGEIIKLLMITSSGTEGINLRNTRYVHIMEPYWNMTRIEQVIGRARRICSHKDLPEELRTVKVFFYMASFSQEQKTNKRNITIMTIDTSKVDGSPLTTDEYLYELAYRKMNIINSILRAVKETSIDCTLYSDMNKDENVVCYGLGMPKTNDFLSHPSIEDDLNETEINVKQKVLKLKKTNEINGVVYAIDENTLDLYDLQSYEKYKKQKGELILVGKLKMDEKGYRLIRYDVPNVPNVPEQPAKNKTKKIRKSPPQPPQKPLNEEGEMKEETKEEMKEEEPEPPVEKLKIVAIKKVKYAFDEKTTNVYDYEKYKNGEYVLIGKLIKKDDKYALKMKK